MPRPSRARRILKWTGVGLSFVILAAWVMSLGYWAIIPAHRHLMLGFCPGRVYYSFTSANAAYTYGDSDGIQKTPNPRPRLMWPEVEVYRRLSTGEVVSRASLPFWLLLLLTAIPTAWLWHRDRRLISCSPGHLLCIRCGYDLTGNTSGVCPECGDKVHPPAVLADSECGELKTAGELTGERRK